MKILFIGDTIGRPGRHAVKTFLPKVKKEHEIDLVILNAENLSGGIGTNEKSLVEMEEAGVDFFTGGNDSFRDPAVFRSDRKNLLRPDNLESGAPGKGTQILEIQGKKLLVINLLGRVFMKIPATCPFRKMDALLEEYKDVDLDGIFVDFHAEATSEKLAFFHAFEDRISAMIGTHTHVPTADGHISSSSGAYYQTDIGLTGPIKSIIGFDADECVQNFYSPVGKKKLKVAKGKTIFRSVLLDISEKKTHHFERIEFFETEE